MIRVRLEPVPILGSGRHIPAVTGISRAKTRFQETVVLAAKVVEEYRGHSVVAHIWCKVPFPLGG
jgi:hypothetical protein